MPNHLWPADNFTATIKTIPCPDCIERPGRNLSSLESTALCPTCAGYGNILAPEEVERTKADRAAMEQQGAYHRKRRAMGRAKLEDLKPWDENIGGRWSA